MKPRPPSPVTAPCRHPDGTYRVFLLADDSQWAKWDPHFWPSHRTYSPGATDAFRREVEKTDWGRACRVCCYLEFEHNIDGDEKAPCGGFE